MKVLFFFLNYSAAARTLHILSNTPCKAEVACTFFFYICLFTAFYFCFKVEITSFGPYMKLHSNWIKNFRFSSL